MSRVSAPQLLSLPLRLLGFGLWFAWQVVVTAGAVIHDVVTPGHQSTPRIVLLDLGRTSDAHLTALSLLITLTPGTLTLGVEELEDGGRALLVHSLYHGDNPAAVADLADMDTRLRRATRIGDRS